MRKRIIYVIIIVVLLLTGCTIGGSFYMLNFSLTPNAKILSKDADSYPYMYRNYPAPSRRTQRYFYYQSARYPASCILCCRP